MMKKILVLLLIINGFLFAQDFSGVKICVNPGHGGHDSNDRYIPATGFWESEGNLTKGLELRNILESHGCDVVMTRTQNRSSDDLYLSQIVAIANTNNVDYMHSIHSNAHNAYANYTLILYQGHDYQPTYPDSRTMALAIGSRIKKTNRTTASHVRGDFDFYGTGQPYLGVFKGLNMPGTLSEGSFHDYVPESFRLQNLDYRKNEAWAIARGMAEFFEAGDFEVGNIAGIVRDKSMNVDYSYRSGTNDRYKPVNNIKVTLEPGNLVYEGDDMNNGFFLFDSLQPGEYNVIYEADDYQKDTSVVTVKANDNVFADKFLNLKPDSSAPYVVKTVPEDAADNIGLSKPLYIYFDKKMNESSVENSLSTSPGIFGTYEWLDEGKTLKITPNSLLSGQYYSVTIGTDAMSYWNVNFDEAFTFTFSTKTELNLLSTYPMDNETDVSLSTKIVVKFDAGLEQTTLGGNVIFTDSQGNTPSFRPVHSEYSKGYLILNLLEELKFNENYTLELKSGIEDTDGLSLGQDYTINFKTTSTELVSSNVINDLESGTWWDPEQSGSTVGTDPEATTFSMSDEMVFNGEKAGKLAYTFTGSNGLCRLYTPDQPKLGSNEGQFGIWVYGNHSNNLLQYWFYDEEPSNHIVTVDTLNWYGWKLKTIDKADITGSGEKRFHSLVIKQTAEGSASSVLYFDDIQNDVVTGLDEFVQTPTQFKLLQNYPNPFNPSTRIAFQVPEQSTISLEIFNILGEKVATLLNNVSYNVGTYSTMWNGRNSNGQMAPTGPYFYVLKSDNFRQVKKMMLIK